MNDPLNCFPLFFFFSLMAQGLLSDHLLCLLNGNGDTIFRPHRRGCKNNAKKKEELNRERAMFS